MNEDKYQYRFWPLFIALTFVWALFFVEQIQAKTNDTSGRRVALIVGNSNYDSVYSLKNAVNDSISVSAVLSRLGFDVIETSDVTKAEFLKALEKFSAAAQDAEAAVFYYSGHGFQLGGSNFLVPVDAKLDSREAILSETLRLNDVIEAVQDRNRQTLIFLDACRNNPLPESIRDKTMVDGLAQLEAGTGTFVAFATQPGNITRDGAGNHSPFAAALIEHMETPGISISDMMIRVRNSVEVATLQTQTPWDQSSLRNQFYFSPEEEVDADLTEEDKQLLLSLPPALRKKFATQFGIKFSEDGKILTKTVEIKRRFTISAGGNNTPSDEPVAEKKLAIKGRFRIAAGDSEEPVKTEKAPVIIASLGTEKKTSAKPELSPLDENLASGGANFVTRPSFRPDTQQLHKQKIKPGEGQLVAALSPSETKSQVAQRIEPAISSNEPSQPGSLTANVKNTPVPTPATRVLSVRPQAPVTKSVIVNSNSAAVVAERVTNLQSGEISSAAKKRKKPRVIAITNPELANSPKIAAKKNVQMALSSQTRSIETLKPSTRRSSLQPKIATAKRLVGKEVVSKQDNRKTQTDVQVAALEPSAKVSPKPNLIVPKVKPIGMADADAGKKKPDVTVKVASLTDDRSAQNSRSDETYEPSITPPSHAFEVQAELARLGCYRSKVDGLWGAKSARALFRYYGNKKAAPTELEPNANLLALLRNDEVVVCKRTIRIIKKNSTKVNDKAIASSSRKKSKRIRIRKSVTIRKKALKKSLSKGVFR